MHQADPQECLGHQQAVCFPLQHEGECAQRQEPGAQGTSYHLRQPGTPGRQSQKYTITTEAVAGEELRTYGGKAEQVL